MDAISKFRSDEARDAYIRLYDSGVAASHIPVAESDVETSVGRTHLLIAGERSPLIALHALAMSSTMWLPLLHVLAARHHVVMIDVIGQASKSIASKPITTTAHIVGWLDETLRQYVCGATGFRAPLNAVRPTRCDLHPLAQLGIPVTIAIGREESLHDGPEAAARFRRVLPCARIEVVDGANHVIPVDQPVRVEQILTDFLR